MWTEKQWDAFCSLIEDGWPGEFDDRAAAAWRLMLDPIEPADAIAGVRRMTYWGRTFRPSVSELIGELRWDPSQPTFDEAFETIFGAQGVLRAQPPRPESGPTRYGSEAERLAAVEQAIVDRAEVEHPLIASFVAVQSIARLRGLSFDGEWGEKRRADLRASWDMHVEAVEGREVAQLAAGRGTLGLHRPDTRKLLGLGES